MKYQEISRFRSQTVEVKLIFPRRFIIDYFNDNLLLRWLLRQIPKIFHYKWLQHKWAWYRLDAVDRALILILFFVRYLLELRFHWVHHIMTGVFASFLFFLKWWHCLSSILFINLDVVHFIKLGSSEIIVDCVSFLTARKLRSHWIYIY